MIHKNLTPFFWGPRITSRTPPQPEMAVCVRGVFRLAPGQPLAVVEDPMQQGFMSGDTFAPDDIDQQGALLHASDFADWKLHAELLLRGSCHPPGGNATVCDVRFAVGTWSKALRCFGPRAFTPGLLLGGKVSEPQPFTSMPLTWQNAYGGEGYADNPAGRGFAGEEMPTVELPDGPAAKKGKRGITPATFLPVSPNWPLRVHKRGRRYDAKWKKTRAPFYAEDFDWTHFQSTLPDQWYDGYLRGDEELVFENLHPDAPSWRTRLPALRVRAFVKTLDGRVVEPQMNLDTLLADVDDGKLFLTWRGHVQVQEIDMTDVGVVLIASEQLADEPLPFAHYEALLTEFEADPVGLKTAFAPGMLEMGAAIEAAELAERNGEPMPDLAAVAAALPADCPLPPWFLAAAAGDPDPLGVKQQFPPSVFDDDDPLGVAAQIGDLRHKDKLDAAMTPAGDPSDPAVAAKMLAGLVALMPPEKQATMQPCIDTLQEAIGRMPAGSTPAPARPATLDDAFAAANKSLTVAPGGSAQALPTTDALWAQALAPFDQLQLPELPPLPDVDGQLAAERAALDAQQAKMRDKFGDHPMLGMFAFGHRLIDRMPRLQDIVPDLSPLVGALGKLNAQFVAMGVGAAALAPLSRFMARVDGLAAQLPQRTPAPAGDYAGKDLRRRDLRGKDLRGQDLRGANLGGALLDGADLSGADLRQADLTGAVLSGASLIEANFTGATLTKARLDGVKAARAVLADCRLDEADLTGADLEAANLEQATCTKARFTDARLPDADLRFADLSKTDLRRADLSRAQLSLATIHLAKADGANLGDVTFDMARLTKSRFHGAKFTGARSSMGSLSGSDLTGADLRGVRFEKVDFMKAVLDGADCRGASLEQAILRDTQAIGADLRDATLTQASATGAAVFRKARFSGADGKRSTWMDVDLAGADFSHARFANAYFQGVHGDDVDFSAAMLKGACFRRAVLVRPRFPNADLASADFNEARLDGADFRAANCYDAKFLGTKAQQSDFTDAFVAGLQLDDPEAQQR
ncbi:MAG: DUF2169 domain-containing protein [Planctomycetes bacterium]|nr:DUF2169 domain-containing protein [Planctomycetota bacterium]